MMALIALAWLAGCGWMASRKQPPAQLTEIVITGAPLGAFVLVDDRRIGEAVARNDQSEILSVAPGRHKVEIQVEGAIVYREDTEVARGEQRVVAVLSGATRQR